MTAETARYQAALRHPLAPLGGLIRESGDTYTRYRWSVRQCRRVEKAHGWPAGSLVIWAEECEKAAAERGMSLEEWTAAGYTMELK